MMHANHEIYTKITMYKSYTISQVRIKGTWTTGLGVVGDCFMF